MLNTVRKNTVHIKSHLKLLITVNNHQIILEMLQNCTVQYKHDTSIYKTWQQLTKCLTIVAHLREFNEALFLSNPLLQRRIPAGLEIYSYQQKPPFVNTSHEFQIKLPTKNAALQLIIFLTKSFFIRI